MIVSNSTEASYDALAVPKVEASWNPPSDDDMANDTDECQALIDDDDDDNIMQVEHIRNNIISGEVASPGQSDSSGRIEAGLGRRRSSSPMELRRSSRRSSHSRSSTQHWLGMMSARDFMDLPATIPTPEDSAGAVSHKGKTYGGLPAIT